MMDNPKKANQGKYNRSKRKKEHFSKGSKTSNSTDGDKYQKSSDEKDKSKQSNFKGPHASAAAQQPSTATDKTVIKTSEPDSTAQQKIVFANLKKETEEIDNLTQKYGRRSLVSTWTRDFDIPSSREIADDNDGADFNELISGYSSDFVGRHFMLKEEQEWMKQSDSSESPFSLDLKCLETGISCIPFYKRHDLSEKSFNPKEVQLMISEAQSNEILYKNKQTLNQKTENRNVLIDKDPAYDSILSILKQEDSSNTLTNNISKMNAADFISTSVNKVENLEDVNNVSTKTSSSVRGGKELVDNFSDNTNKSSACTYVYDNSKNGDSLEAKGQSQNRSRRSNVTVTYSQNCTENLNVIDDNNTEDVKPKIVDPLEAKGQRQNRSRRNNVTVTYSQNYAAENSKVTDDVNNTEDVKPKDHDTVNKDFNTPEFVIQSLEPRGQRRPRREIKENKISVVKEEEKINEIDKPSISSFIGLNSCRKMKTDEVSIMDKETNQRDLSFNEQCCVTSTRVESNDVHNEINIVSSMKTENSNNDDEKVELNLSSLKRLKDCVKPDHVQNKEPEINNDSIVKSNNDTPLSLFSQDSVKIESNSIIEKNDAVYSCSNERKSEEKSIKANEKLSSTNYDDDLDFLLGLDKPSADLKLTSVSQENDNSLSNLSILQQKLKGNVTITDRKSESNNLKKMERDNISRNEQSKNNNPLDDDLDEWLDSVLEK